jgi:flagellar protein FlbD
MIIVTHFNGQRVALNMDLIERVEETPDTVITLTNGSHYLVKERLDEIIEACTASRAQALAVAHGMVDAVERSPLRLLRGSGGDEDGRE